MLLENKQKNFSQPSDTWTTLKKQFDLPTYTVEPLITDTLINEHLQ
jgi:hypothetical protein